MENETADKKWLASRVEELEEALEDAELSVAHVFFRNHNHLPNGCDGCRDVERTLTKIDPRRALAGKKE